MVLIKFLNNVTVISQLHSFIVAIHTKEHLGISWSYGTLELLYYWLATYDQKSWL